LSQSGGGPIKSRISGDSDSGGSLRRPGAFIGRRGLHGRRKTSSAIDEAARTWVFRLPCNLPREARQATRPICGRRVPIRNIRVHPRCRGQRSQFDNRSVSSACIRGSLRGSDSGRYTNGVATTVAG
jgi:hypothetical protein